MEEKIHHNFFLGLVKSCNLEVMNQGLWIDALCCADSQKALGLCAGTASHQLVGNGWWPLGMQLMESGQNFQLLSCLFKENMWIF